MSNKKTKKQSHLDSNLQLRQITPLNEHQSLVFDLFDENHLLLSGSAGTGKTFLALSLAMKELFRHSQYKKIVIVRSVVQTRDVGFLPGTLTEKIKIFELPFQEIVNNLCQRGDAWEILRSRGFIDFMCTSFLRGLTINDAIIVVDEAQNASFQELDSILTRVGDNCKLIICGDIRQSDLKTEKERTGFVEFSSLFERLNDVQKIEFEPEDIVRSGLVREYLILKEDTKLHAKLFSKIPKASERSSD